MDNPTLYSPDLEANAIGVVLVEPALMYTVADLKPEHFYREYNQQVWSTMRDVVHAGKTLDYPALVDEMERRHPGPNHYVEVSKFDTATVRRADSLREYADRIIEYHARRQTVRDANDLARAAYDLKEDIFTARASHAGTVLASDGRRSDTKSGGDWATEAVEKMLENRANPPAIFNLPTYHPALDEALDGGVETGGVVGIAGRPGAGKSMWAANWAYDITRFNPGLSGILYSIEQPGRETFARILSMASGVRASAILRGQVNDMQVQQVKAAASEIRKSGLMLSESTSVTVERIRAEATRAKVTKDDFRFVIVDYLGLMSDKPELGETERLGYISRNLTLIAKDLDIVVVMLLSMTKEGFDLSGLKGARGPGTLMHDLKYYFEIVHDTPDVSGSDVLDPMVRWLVPSKARNAEGDFRKPFAYRYMTPGIPRLTPLEPRTVKL